MQELFSKIKIESFPFEISHQDRILSMGSCFSDHIGNRLKSNWFDIVVNPFGVLFNPLSIAQLISRALENDDFTDDEIQERKDLYFLYDTHGKLSNHSRASVLNSANEALLLTKEYIQSSDYLFITFGTAYYFALKEGNKIVGNCHKMPQNLFHKKKTSSARIQELYNELFEKIKTINPSIQIVLTVSPIRHIKDGFIENNRSKAELLIASEKLEKQSDFCHYFPSYEILMDELRDYRFYGNDLAHPSETALKYIFERFSVSTMNDKTLNHLSQIQKIVLQENHRPLFPESEESKKSVERLLEKKQLLRKKVFQID